MSQSSSDDTDSDYNLSDPDVECFVDETEAISEAYSDSSNVLSDEDQVSESSDSDDSNVKKCSARSKRVGNKVKHNRQGDNCLERGKRIHKKKEEN